MMKGPGKVYAKHRGAIVKIKESPGMLRVSLGLMNMLRRKLYVAMHPEMTHSKIKTLSEMTAEEVAEIEQRYGAKVKTHGQG